MSIKFPHTLYIVQMYIHVHVICNGNAVFALYTLDLLKQNESAKNNLGKIQSQLTTTETTLTSLKKVSYVHMHTQVVTMHTAAIK